MRFWEIKLTVVNGGELRGIFDVRALALVNILVTVGKYHRSALVELFYLSSQKRIFIWFL